MGCGRRRKSATTHGRQRQSIRGTQPKGRNAKRLRQKSDDGREGKRGNIWDNEDSADGDERDEESSPDPSNEGDMGNSPGPDDDGAE